MRAIHYKDYVWKIVRICEEVPIFENILYHLVLSAIECRYSNIDEFQSELAYFINARETHLYVNGEEINTLNDFTQAIEKSDD